MAKVGKTKAKGKAKTKTKTKAKAKTRAAKTKAQTKAKTEANTKATAKPEVKTKTIDLSELRLDHFKKHVNRNFEVSTPHGPVTLKLERATAHGETMPGGRAGGGFSLHFVGDHVRLAQGIYPVTHAKLGTMEIFLVPAGPGAGGFGYHAVFG